MTRNEFFLFKKILKFGLILQEKSWALATRIITIQEHTIGTIWTFFTLRSTIIVNIVIIFQWYSIITYCKMSWLFSRCTSFSRWRFGPMWHGWKGMVSNSWSHPSWWFGRIHCWIDVIIWSWSHWNWIIIYWYTQGNT